MDVILHFLIVAGTFFLLGFGIGYWRGYGECKRDLEKPVEFRIGKLDLREGDALILHTDEIISDCVAERLKRNMEERFPGHQCTVFGGGMKMGVVSDAIQGG